ncbi:MAG: hypothetical protein H6Q70_2674 [Firmicutes bacterium]|nr:hypothetical protein [Bacillota bacterium]
MYIDESRYTGNTNFKIRVPWLYWIQKNNNLIWRNVKWQQ